MKRKLFSAFLAVVLCLSLSFSVFAAPDVDFVVDELGNLTDSEIKELNALAGEIYDEKGVGIFFVFTKADSLQDYNVSRLVGDMDDYYVMLENDSSWYTFAGGAGKRIDADTEEELRDIYDTADTYVGGVEEFLLAAADCFADATEAEEEALDECLVFDEADLLSDKEEIKLNEKLGKISKEYKAQIIVMTLESMDGGDIDEFVEYVYDGMELGYGDDRDGVLLLVSMDPREYRILSNGYAGKAIGEDEIDVIGSAFKGDLSDGNYAEAFHIFADQCQYYLDGYLNGFPFDAGMTLVIALVIGIVIGVIVAFVLKGQLKSVRKQNQANVYVKPGSMQLTTSNDLFLYRSVQRVKKESSSSSSSGGSSRSVGGGSF